MAFNPNNYKAPSAKKLPVILLLDVSGSMDGEKIEELYDSVTTMVDTFVDEQVKETVIDVSIITFGKEVNLHTPYTSVVDLQKQGINKFKASGATPLGVALTMAKDMIDDKATTPSKIYRPAVVLVSDGMPNDSWEAPLDRFINDGRSAKCQRFAIAIGNDVDRKMLEQFTGDPSLVFMAEGAKDISGCFKKFTMSVSTRASRASSQNPNAIPKPASARFDNNPADDADDDDEYI